MNDSKPYPFSHFCDSFTPIETGVQLTILVIILILFVPSVIQSIQASRENASAVKTHNLNIVMFSYANDHEGNYPTGPTSTAIFQTLYDGKYLNDPAQIYLPLNGKIAYPNKPVIWLHAQNVSFDVVEHADGTGLNSAKDPGDVPLLFSTGLGLYTFENGSNLIKINHPAQAVWGKDGVTIAYLNQECLFVHTVSDATINLTKPRFKIGTGSYKSVQP